MSINSAALSPWLAISGLPELGPGPREGILPLAELDDQFNKMAPANAIPPLRRQLVKATVYLWHDHLDPAHSISQGIATSDGSYVHGIVHRREPDFGNARYWFHRVGAHPVFPGLARRASELLSSASNSTLLKKLISAGAWNPLAFIDACEQTVEGAAEVDLLRQIQATELELLLKSFVD